MSQLVDRSLVPGLPITRRKLLVLATNVAGLAGAGVLAACEGPSATTTTATTATVIQTQTQQQTVTVTQATVSTAVVTSVQTQVLPATPAPTTAPAKPSQVVLSVASDKVGANTEQLYKGWNADLAKVLPSAKIDWITPAPTENIEEKQLVLLAGGTPPDFTISSFQELALRDAVVDLDPYFKQDKDVSSWKFAPSCWAFVNLIQDNGHPILWAFPGNPDALALWVNLDTFAKAGLDYKPDQPWDWTTFEDASRKLTTRAADGTIQQAAWRPFPWYGEMLLFTEALGGDLFSYDDATGWVKAATFSTPAGIDAISLYSKLVVNDRVTSLGPDGTHLKGFALETGNVAMTTSWMGYQSRLTKVGFNWDLLGFPVARQGDKWPYQFANNSQMGSIYKQTRYRDEAFQVGKYLISDGHVVRMTTLGALPIVYNSPAQASAWKTELPGKHTEIYDKVVTSEPFKRVPWSWIKTNKDQAQAPISKAMTDLFAGKISPQTFAQTVDSQVNGILKAGL